MVEKNPQPKPTKLGISLRPEDAELLDQVKTDKNLFSRKDALHVIFDKWRGTAKDEAKQETPEIDCEFFLSANKKLYCVYESYGRHRPLISAEECSKCKIHLWKLPQKTKVIPRCPKTTGLYNPDLCNACFQQEPTTFANCETQQFFRSKEPKAETRKIEKEQPSPKTDEIERLTEKERIKTEALKERTSIALEAKKEEAKLKRTQHSFSGKPRVDWGDSYADTSSLGDGYRGY